MTTIWQQNELQSSGIFRKKKPNTNQRGTVLLYNSNYITADGKSFYFPFKLNAMAADFSD